MKTQNFIILFDFHHEKFFSVLFNCNKYLQYFALLNCYRLCLTLINEGIVYSLKNIYTLQFNCRKTFFGKTSTSKEYIILIPPEFKKEKSLTLILVCHLSLNLNESLEINLFLLSLRLIYLTKSCAKINEIKVSFSVYSPVNMLRQLNSIVSK